MSSKVAETTSLLTNSPMENAEVSVAAVIDGTADFILGFSNSSMRNFFKSPNLSYCMHNPYTSLGILLLIAIICAPLLNSKVAAKFFIFVMNSSTSSLAGSNFRFLHASKAAWVVLPSLANLLRNCHLKDLSFCSLVYLSSYLYPSISSIFIVLTHHLAFQTGFLETSFSGLHHSLCQT